MAKKITIRAEIQPDGKVVVRPEGTEGSECINFMDFIDSIPGFQVVETVKTDDYNKRKKTQVVNSTKTSSQAS